MNHELDDELSAGARTLLEAGRDADLPSANDRARVRTKLALQLAGAAAGAAAGKAAAQLAVGGKIGAGTLTGKALLAAAVLGLAGVGAHVAFRSHDPAAASRPAPVEHTPQAAAEAEAAPSAGIEPPQLGAAPGVPDGASRAAPRPAAPAAHGPAAHAAARDVDHDWAADLQAEVSLLAQAQRALAAGDPDAALDHLAQHRAQFPKGALSQERRAASAIAHCQAGRLARGRALLADLPEDSPLSARAEETCRGDTR